VKILITDGVNPVTPDDVSVVGDTVTVEVPSGGGASFDPDAFVMEVATFLSGSSALNQFIIQVAGIGNNYNVKTSDGQTINGNTGNLTITFPTEGIYTLEIAGSIRLNYSASTTADRNKIINIINWGKDFILLRLSDSNSIRVSATDTIKNFSTSIAEAFRGTALFKNDIINFWIMTSVTDIRAIFRNNTQFNQPLNNWDVSNVTLMAGNNLGAFAGCTSFNKPLNNWDVAKVTTMQQMFFNATSFNQNINNWDVSNATNMASMFQGANSFNQPLDNWDVSNVNTMSSMFMGASNFNQDLSMWDVSGVTNFQTIFFNANSFNQYLGDWQLNSGLTTMIQIFRNSGMSSANYTDTIVGWANYVFDNSGTPSGVNMTLQTGRTFDTSRSGGANFADAGAARTYLTTTATWTISGDTVI
jgi:surface protein